MNVNAAIRLLSLLPPRLTLEVESADVLTVAAESATTKRDARSAGTGGAGVLCCFMVRLIHPPRLTCCQVSQSASVNTAERTFLMPNETEGQSCSVPTSATAKDDVLERCRELCRLIDDASSSVHKCEVRCLSEEAHLPVEEWREIRAKAAELDAAIAEREKRT